MRIHSAAAFLLAKGFGSSGNNNHELTLDMGDIGFMTTVPSVPTGWARNNLSTLKMTSGDDSEFVNSVAGAFNNMNHDMQVQHGYTLDALKEISANFKKLAESDLTKLFPRSNGASQSVAEVPIQNNAIAPAETALDTSAPLAGSTFSHPTQHAFYSDTVPEQAPAVVATTPGSSYMQSLKKSANFAPSNESSARASPQAASGLNYLGASQGQAKTQSTDLPQRKVSYSAYGSSQAPQQQPVARAGSSYLDAIAGPQNQPAAQRQSYAPYGGSYSNPAPRAAQGGSYLDSMHGSAMHYPTPPLEPYPYMEEPPQPQNPYMGEPTVAYADPRIPMDAAILQFSPDNENVMAAGSAPKIETPRVRYVRPDPGFYPDAEWSQSPRGTVNDSNRIGSQRVSGHIPNLQERQAMNGANYVPEPKPKAPRPVFSKMYSGIHSDFDEMINPASVQAVPPPTNVFVPRPAPKPAVEPRRSIAAQRVKDIPDWQNDFAHPTQQVASKPQQPVSVFAKKVGGYVSAEASNNYAKPEPPRSVFSQKVSGVADLNGNVPPGYTKPEQPMSVFSQKVRGTADFNGPPPNVPKPEPPRSVFSQKIKGVADFNGPPPNVPKPEPPRSIFAQKIASNVPREVAASPHGDFAANGYVPVPNPRAAAPEPQQYGRAVRAVTEWNPGFAPDYPEAMEAEGIRSVQIPQYNQGQNHQNWPTNMGNSFEVTPDDRIGSLRDEYLR